jgi:hypothetical protein
MDVQLQAFLTSKVYDGSLRKITSLHFKLTPSRCPKVHRRFHKTIISKEIRSGNRTCTLLPQSNQPVEDLQNEDIMRNKAQQRVR